MNSDAAAIVQLNDSLDLRDLEEDAEVVRERGDRDGLGDPGQVVDGDHDDRRRARVQRHGSGTEEERAEEQRGGVEPQRPRLHRRALPRLRLMAMAAAGTGGRAALHGHQQHEPCDGHRDGALGGAGGRRRGAVVGQRGARVRREREGEVPADEEDGGEGDEEGHVHCVASALVMRRSRFAQIGRAHV